MADGEGGIGQQSHKDRREGPAGMNKIFSQEEASRRTKLATRRT